MFVDFREKGLSKIQGKNVSVMTKQLEAVAISLNKVDSLPEEAPLGILKGVSICSCNNFKSTFEFQGTKERIKHIRQKHSGGANTLDQIKTILRGANDLYNSLCTAGKWNVVHKHNHFNSCWCWNCGGNHGLNKCRKPKDEVLDSRK